MTANMNSAPRGSGAQVDVTPATGQQEIPSEDQRKLDTNAARAVAGPALLNNCSNPIRNPNTNPSLYRRMRLRQTQGRMGTFSLAAQSLAERVG